MQCDVCNKKCTNPQYVWAVSYNTMKNPMNVVQGVFVACQGPACAGQVCNAIDKICDAARENGLRWMLMDCDAVARNYNRLIKDYDWSADGIVAPPKVA